MRKYKLPDLQYDYAALEPHISGAVMELHHGKHHRAYVENANKAIEKLRDARVNEDFSSIALLQHQLAFNISGHVLHSLFWNNLAPKAGGRPEGVLAETIARDFGSFDKFKKQLVQVAMTITGSGWAALVWDPLMRRIGTTQVHDHQSEVTQGSVPLLVLDVWEHAYYLQYRNDKAKFFEAVWNLWNWPDVARRLEAAQKLDLAIGAAVVT